MKKIILLIAISILLVHCQSKTNVYIIDASRSKAINEIVAAVISQDSLNVSKKERDTNLFCIDLAKLNIQNPVKRKDGMIEPPAKPLHTVLFENLMLAKFNNALFFTKNDSITLLEQNLNPEKFRISSEIITTINATTLAEILKKKKTGASYQFYQMTIPLFSLDGNKAYTQLTYGCEGLCGNGKAIYLQKINGKWHVIDTFTIWMN